jgi:hypothetical protein
MSIEYKVPRLLWENFESVLLAQSKRYIAELAKRLGVPEKDLIKKVLPTSDSLKVVIQDTQAECNQCKAYIQHDNLTVFCRKVAAYGSEYCAMHRNKRMFVIDGTNPVQLQRLKDVNTLGPLWISDNTLYNSMGNVVGKINREEEKIKMFVVQQEQA